jgi:small subunit ribosomal protein S9
MTDETVEASVAEVPEEAPVAEAAPVPGADRPQATGKRKNSIARVIIHRGGDGSITCNGRPIDEYFPRLALVRAARSPLTVTGLEGQVSVVARLNGGGVTGQAGALRHGIARALVELDENLRPELKREGMLARDSRIKERKKAGLRGARKRPQFSKR